MVTNSAKTLKMVHIQKKKNTIFPNFVVWDTALGEIPVFSLLAESNKSFLLPVFGLVVSLEVNSVFR